MCAEAIDDCLAALKFVHDWFVTSTMTKILFPAFCTDENMLSFNEDSGNVVFTCIGLGILNIDFNNFNLDDINYDEDDPKAIILVRLLAWHITFGKRKALKKELNKELIPEVWDPKRL